MKQESQRRTRSAVWPVEIAVVLDGGAEAGRADHGAVGAGEAARGDVVPALVGRIALQQLLKPVGVQLAPHLARRCASTTASAASLVCPARPAPRGSVGQHRGAGRAADLDQKSVSCRCQQFGQRQIEAGFAFGPVFIETQKQVPPAWPQFTATMKLSCRRC